MNTKARKKLITRRKECGFTQKQVAEYLGKARTTYTQYETGVSNPSFKDIIKLKKLFNYYGDDLFF